MVGTDQVQVLVSSIAMAFKYCLVLSGPLLSPNNTQKKVLRFGVDLYKYICIFLPPKMMIWSFESKRKKKDGTEFKRCNTGKNKDKLTDNCNMIWSGRRIITIHRVNTLTLPLILNRVVNQDISHTCKRRCTVDTGDTTDDDQLSRAKLINVVQSSIRKCITTLFVHGDFTLK